jgi:hypothetical protein
MGEGLPFNKKKHAHGPPYNILYKILVKEKDVRKMKRQSVYAKTNGFG